MTLRIPGEFLHLALAHLLDTLPHVAQLKRAMVSLWATAPRSNNHHIPFLPNNLMTCPFVFVQHDAVRAPLQAPYDGPFKVLHQTDKHFTLDINSRHEVISIDDQLKPAYVDITPPSTLPAKDVQPLPYVTCSGRSVHPPSRL